MIVFDLPSKEVILLDVIMEVVWLPGDEQISTAGNRG